MRIASSLLNIFFIISVFFCFSCEKNKPKKYTPKEFLNYTVAQKDSYIKDSMEIVKQLTLLLIKHEGFFKNSAYSDSTQLLVDTILYSSDFSKLAAFIVTKNPTYRQLVPNMKYYWYYDATCYLGIRQQDTIDLNWLGPSFTNSYDKKELSAIIRDSYFTLFATKDTVGPATYEYNLNDVRFWNSSIWKEIEEKRARRKTFEEEKIKNPENVYMPSH